MQLQYLMNNDFSREVNQIFFYSTKKSFESFCLVTGANTPAGGGYVDEFQGNTGGAKQQLLTLIRSVRTVMRGMVNSSFLRLILVFFCFVLVPLIFFNIVAIVFLILFG